MTAHSHQAWPDVVREAMTRYFDDSARLVDDKWAESILPLQAHVGARLMERMGLEGSDPVAFASSTHDLLVRWLSAVSVKRVITTGGEFHSLRRQLARYQEDGLQVDWVPSFPRESLRERILGTLVEGPPGALMLSAVFFEDGYVLDGLVEIIDAAQKAGHWVYVDAYHAFNAVELEWPRDRERLFVVAGGYKYAGFGEGVCWMRLPPSCTLRPAVTGWFSEFSSVAEPGLTRTIYGTGGDRFAGATFDGVGLYRARAGLDHWDHWNLDVAALRARSTALTSRLLEGLGSARSLVALAPEKRGAFLALRCDQAARAVGALRDQGIWADSRGPFLRIGPGPYATDAEVDRTAAAVDGLGLSALR